MKKTITKKAPAKKNADPKPAVKTAVHNPRTVMSVSRGFTHEQETIVRKFLGVQNIVQGVLGTLPPPNNPYELASYKDGYHWRCIKHLVAATVGQGYDADPELREHIDNPNSDYKMRELLKRTAEDYLVNGWMTVHVLKGNVTANIWHSPAIKTRIKVDRTTLVHSYIRFEYEPWLGWMSYVEEPEFVAGGRSGVRQMNNISRSGNRYYGDPDYLAVKDLLRLNWSINIAAQHWFDNGLMSDLAIIEKGMGREDDEIDQMKSYIGKHLKGVENSHKILYMQVAPDESVEFKELSSDFPAKDSTDLKKANTEEIVVAHGMSMRLVGANTGGSSLGGLAEAQVQLSVFGKLVAKTIQDDIQDFYRQLFKDLGFPKSDSFTLRQFNIDTPKDTMDTLSEGVQTQIIELPDAQHEWATKSNADKARSLIKYLRGLRKELIQ